MVSVMRMLETQLYPKTSHDIEESDIHHGADERGRIDLDNKYLVHLEQVSNAFIANIIDVFDTHLADDVSMRLQIYNSKVSSEGKVIT